jgi:hypothetical protein
VEFVSDKDMRDLGGIALLIGVTDNDLKGRSSADPTEAALVHGDPNAQDEHCLRGENDDEPNGSEAAVLACQAYIRDQVQKALGALTTEGVPDPDARLKLPVFLAIRGSVDASLPTYYVRMGQALHALQDGFTHNYRTADSMQISVVHNWIDYANERHSERIDGPQHHSELDDCNGEDLIRQTRRALAEQASLDLLRATLDTTSTPEEKLADVDTVLATYFTYAPGCTFDNAWCNAPESVFKPKGIGPFSCTQSSVSLWGALAAVLLLLKRSRRFAASCVFVMFVCTTARADQGKFETLSSVVPIAEPSNETKFAWGFYIGGSGSLHRPAAAVHLGTRFRLHQYVMLGLDGEWNPWMSFRGVRRVSEGVANAFGTFILRLPLVYGPVNLRSTLHLGMSFLLFDLYGAPKGSMGPYVAASPLGVEIKVAKYFLVIVNPLNIALPIPHVTGAALMYPQYRFSVGIESLFF